MGVSRTPKKIATTESPTEEPTAAQITVRRIGRREATIRVESTAPLIVQQFSAKARQKMLDSQQGKRVPKENRDPERDFQAAIHRLADNRHGFPATGFKAATVGASRYYGKDVTMTGLRPVIFVRGEGPDMLVPLDAAEPKLYESYVRNSSGVADLRFRPIYESWSALLHIVYVPSMLSLDSLVALVDAGGMGGIGEWRPASKQSNTGVFGTYQVDDAYEIQDRPA